MILYFFLNCALISFFIVFVTACFMYQLSHSALSFALIVINLRNLRQLPKFYDENKWHRGGGGGSRTLLKDITNFTKKSAAVANWWVLFLRINYTMCTKILVLYSIFMCYLRLDESIWLRSVRFYSFKRQFLILLSHFRYDEAHFWENMSTTPSTVCGVNIITFGFYILKATKN